MDLQSLITGGGLVFVGGLVTKLIDAFLIPRVNLKFEEARHTREVSRDQGKWLRDARLKGFTELSAIVQTHRIVRKPESRAQFEQLLAEANLLSHNPEIQIAGRDYLKRAEQTDKDEEEIRETAMQPEDYDAMWETVWSDLDARAVRLINALRKELLA